MVRKFFLISRLGKSYAGLVWIGKKQGFISTNKSQELQISDQSQGGKVAHRWSLCVATVPTHVAHLALGHLILTCLHLELPSCRSLASANIHIKTNTKICCQNLRFNDPWIGVREFSWRFLEWCITASKLSGTAIWQQREY